MGRHLRRSLGGRPVVATFHSTQLVDAVPLDVRDERAVRTLVAEVRPATIILAAAEPNVERCEREPEETRRVNVDVVRPLAEEAERLGALLVVFSSEYVFDGSKGRYAEDDAVHPLNDYGRQKIDLEEIASRLPRHLVCRTSGVFGVEPAEKNFVCQLVRALAARRPFAVPSDQLITPTYAPSLADTVVRLVDMGAGGLLHVAGPRIMPRMAFAELVCETFELDCGLLRPIPTDELGLDAPRPRGAGLADQRLRALVGHALVDPEEGLRSMSQLLLPQSKGTSGLS
ncbi:MAG: SDR family oxidoreductase [Chloroflexota bacterium]|nr:SDR family oxidoreductase [Chloroflexota bacterium]